MGVLQLWRSEISCSHFFIFIVFFTLFPSFNLRMCPYQHHLACLFFNVIFRRPKSIVISTHLPLYLIVTRLIRLNRFGFLMSPFLPFAAVSLGGVASLADTFPSFPVSGPFLPDVPGFQVPPDSIFPPQRRSSSRALPLHLHLNNCSDVFCLISSLDVPEPFQPSHNHRYRFHPCFLQDLLISPVF